MKGSKMALNDGKRHSFSVDFAKEYGIEAAILAEHFVFWIEKNQADGRNFYDGRYWTFCSVSSLQSIFPYLSAGKIRGALNLLLREGILIKGNFNKSAYDRTLWYSFADAFYDFKKSICKNQQMDCDKFANRNSDICEPIPDSPTDSPTDSQTNITPPTPQRGECAEPKTVSTPPVIVLPLNSGEYGVSQEQINEWMGLYPAVDVMQQLRNMKGWLDSNPDRRKTKRGILRFITAWLSKEQDRGRSRGQTQQQQKTQGRKSWAELAREMEARGEI